MNNFKISVIICCYTLERFEDVLEAINSVKNQTKKPHEIIVSVDNNRILYEKLQNELVHPAKAVFNDNHSGASETKSIGIGASTGDIIAFLDDDAIAASDWLEQLSSYYENPQVIATGGKAVPIWPEKNRPRWFPEELDWIVGGTHKGPSNESREVRNMIGCNMSFRREVFVQIGVFNNQVGRVGKVQGAGEEAEICLRIKHSLPDRLILFNPMAIIHHKVHPLRVKWNYLLRRSYDEGHSKYLIKKIFIKSGTPTLSTENSYACYLLLRAVPARLFSFYKNNSLLQILAMMLSMFAVSVGYFRGRLEDIRISQ